MKMRKIVPIEADNGRPILIYDCSIEDLKIRAEEAITANSARHAASILGVSHTTIQNAIKMEAIIAKKKVFSPKLNKWFAVRIIKNHNQNSGE